MKTTSLEKIAALNKMQESNRMAASSCNCSWRYDIHVPIKKSVYEAQKCHQ